jgi:2-phospho-L-lactate/phosphoenolpyruvate guanylyltransferase
MSTLAVLPIKSFPDAKQRLAEELSPGPRRALVEAMFADVLVALRRSTGVDRMLVVSDDNSAQEIGAGYGALVLDDDRQGHSEAAQLAIRRALEDGIERVLLVPGDCPLLDPAELDELLSRPRPGRSALIVPDRHGTGTNALLLSPPDSLTPAFGPGSCQRHAEQARLAGTEHEVVELSSLALDVDTPEDLEELIAVLKTRHGGAAHTRGMLNQMLRSRT